MTHNTVCSEIFADATVEDFRGTKLFVDGEFQIRGSYTLDFILVQQYVILYKLCTEKWLLCLLAWLLVRGTVINTSANCCS